MKLSGFEVMKQRKIEDWSIADLKELEGEVLMTSILHSFKVEMEVSLDEIRKFASDLYRYFLILHKERKHSEIIYQAGKLHTDKFIENKDKEILFNRRLVDAYYVSKNTTSVSHLKFPSIILFSKVERYFPSKAGFKEFPLHCDVGFQYE